MYKFRLYPNADTSSSMLLRVLNQFVAVDRGQRDRPSDKCRLQVAHKQNFQLLQLTCLTFDLGLAIPHGVARRVPVRDRSGKNIYRPYDPFAGTEREEWLEVVDNATWTPMLDRLAAILGVVTSDFQDLLIKQIKEAIPEPDDIPAAADLRGPNWDVGRSASWV